MKSWMRLSLTLLVLGLFVFPLGVWAMQDSDDFDPTLSVVGVMAPSTLGLPGEQITWIITVTNNGAKAGADLVINDTVPKNLRIDFVEIERGWQRLADESVEFTVARLEPGETVGMQIVTTVVAGPADGLLTNRVTLRGKGEAGTVTREAMADIYVPTGLPATGYAPNEDWPGYGEPSLRTVALVALGAVVLTAAVIFKRGQLTR